MSPIHRLCSSFCTFFNLATRFVFVVIAISILSQGVSAQPAEFTQGSSGSNNMVLKVPITIFPGRGQSVPVTLYYSSKVWRLGFIKSIYYTSGGKQSVAEAIYSEHSTAGWTTSLDVPKVEWPKQNDVFWSDGKPYARGTLYPFTYRVARVYIHLPDGSVHELRKSDPVYQDNGSIDMVGTFYGVDGSRLRYDSTGATTGTLYLPDGTRYVLNGTTTQCIDRNGNTLSYNATTRQWTDTMDRVIGMPWPVSPQAGDYSYTVPGFNNGTITYTLKFRQLSDVLSPGSPALKPIGDYYLPDPSQEPGDYNSSNFPQPTQMASMFASGYSEFEELPSNFTRVIGRGQVGTNVFNPVVLAEVVYPNNQGYKFFYNSFGEIDKVISPSGSYRRYQYGIVPAFEQQLTPYPQATRGITSRWVSANGTGNDEIQWQHTSQWESGTSAYLISVTAPDGLKHETRLYRAPATMKFGYESTGKSGLVYDERTYAPVVEGGALLRRTLTDWQLTSATYNMPSGSGTYTAFRNPRPVRTTNIFLDTGLSDALVSTTSITYDSPYEFTVGVEESVISEYSFATVAQSIAQADPITSMPLGTLIRTTETDYLTDNANYRARNILGFPTGTIVKDGASNIIAQTTIAYDELAYPLLTYPSVTGWTDPQTTTRGNPTTTSRWLNFPASTWIDSHIQYDQCGNEKNIWNENGHQSQVDYSSTYKFAYPTTNTSPPPDPTGAYAQPTGLVNTLVYDFNTGLVTSATDPNGRTTSFEYNDSLRRQTKVTRPDGGWTSTVYNDVPGNIYERTQTLQQTTPSQQVKESYEYFDALGRRARSFVNEGTTYLTNDTQYDSLGRVWKVSNPYRTTSLTDPVNPSNQWVTSTYDSLSRLQKVTTSDGAHVDTAYGYSLTVNYLGTTTTTTDQANRGRKIITDAQGRAIQAVEDPAAGGLNLQTNYTYDVLDNLRKVEQGGQLRYFGYDSLSRLIRVRHVEQNINTNLAWTDPVTNNSGWTAALSYDPAGNMTGRTDARNIATAFQYDRLRRVITVRYTNDPQNTPGVDSYYDGYRGNQDYNIPNSKGRLWQTATLTQVRFTTDQFDVTGSPQIQRQQFWVNNDWGTSYQSGATYNFAGEKLTESYPSGNSVSYTYDPVGRAKSFSGSLGGTTPRTYADTFEYSEWGALQQEKFATQTPLYHKQRFNARGQLWDMRLSTLSFSSSPTNGDRGSIVNYYSNSFTQGGSGTDNNGNLLRQEINVPNSNYFQQNYTYDSLNRLKSVSEKLNGTGTDTFKQLFDYDRWGNRTVNSGSTSNVPRPTYTADVNTNRLVAPAGYAYEYDYAGNQTNDTYTGNGQRTYDAENRMLSAQGTGGVWQSYKYDGGGLRVRRIVNGQEIWQIYGIAGQLLSEYNANVAVASPLIEYGYRNGQLLLTAESTGGGGGSAQNVTWTNAVGVSISGNSLTRTAAGDAWNAGATSSQNIPSGDGYAEFTATEVNKKRAVGLTQSTSVTGYSHLNFGMILGEDGQITINEGAGVYGTFGTYASGDKLRVAIEGGVVKYRKNGALLRTSTVAPAYPLYAGAALYTNGSTVTNAVITSGVQNVTWTNAVGVSISGNSLTRTAAGDAWNAGATSSQSIPSGDGYAEFTATEVNKKRSVGLTQSTSVTGYQHLNFGMILGEDGQITIHEGSSVYGVFGSYTSGDKLRVAIEGGVVKYRKNGTLLRTSTVAPAYPLYAGAALYTNGSTVTNAVISSGSGSGSSSTQFRWLVTDHLGTPRMIVDESGALAGVTRRDYLPFGEEIGSTQVALIGGRDTTPGYTSVTIRQRFTSKERDIETGLDYFGARYYASIQGRFTAADSFAGTLLDPQSLNLYSYVLNNPLMLIDADGHMPHSYGDCGNGFRGGCLWYSQDPKVNNTSPATKDGDPFPYAGCLGCGSPFGVIANITVVGEKESLSTSSDVTATSVIERQPVLQTSALDLLPVYGSARQFLFDYTTHNYEHALLSFAALAIDLSPLGAIGRTEKALSIGIRYAPEAAEVGLEGFTHAAKYGVASYQTLKPLAKGTGLQVHHLIEKRFARLLAISPDKMKSIVVTAPEHQVFTNAWRTAIPYGQGTVNATRQQVTNAARQIYANHPAILRALGLL